MRASFARQGLLATLGARVTRVAPVMPEETAVLSVEFKVNLLAPAAGARFLARGRVVRASRTLTVCRGDAVAFTGDEERHVATMIATMMALGSRGGREAG